MEFLKNHYEKVLLSVVLLGLAVAVAILPMRVPTGAAVSGTNAPTKYRPVDISTNEAALQRLVELKPVVFSGGHNLFSPVEWRRLPNAPHKVLVKVVRDDVVGLGAVIVNKITPLLFILSYEAFIPPKFQMGVVQQANRAFDGKVMKYAAFNDKQDTFTIVATNGPPDNPTQLTVELKDGRRVTVTKDKPFQAIMDFCADLTYPTSAWSSAPMHWPKRRVGDKLVFDQDTNNIVAISSNEVVLSSSSGKRKKLNYKAAP